ncbi:MAG: PH domain-containing protein [Bdellovibrionota bacterium]
MITETVVSPGTLKYLGRNLTRGAKVPLCWVVPIRWRQIVRASIARFFNSRIHTGLILTDLTLIFIKPWDSFGLLDIPQVHAALVLLLLYELLLFLCDLVYQIIYYRTYFYDIRESEQSVVIRRGVLCKTEITLPLARITDVYLEQDFISRLLGLYDLHLSSPTRTSGRVAHMVGIDHEGAHSLRQTLLGMINRADRNAALAMEGMR